MITVDEAYAHCADLARRHYENFPVASVLVPLRMRKHLFAIYAFSRLADDIADEPWTNSVEERLDALHVLEAKLHGTFDVSDDPVFVALQDTIRTARLPLAPFQRLLDAFISDAAFIPPKTWSDVLAYCNNSANPVGELFLRLELDGEEPKPEAVEASNAACTALQIVNFLQDLGLDLERGRRYLPLPDAEVIRLTQALFKQGAPVVGYARSRRIRLELRAIIAGGRTMLDLCEQRTDRLQRPTLGFRSVLAMTRHFVFP
ncbi:MAG: squalene/phytoene synthase family protein [Candidatus Kapabacteria bacterium]|nr:squalene/phytoene synthase family protein [Candidatus Kapabacteria bacterium]